jgi:hypothetical protein
MTCESGDDTVRGRPGRRFVLADGPFRRGGAVPCPSCDWLRRSAQLGGVEILTGRPRLSRSSEKVAYVVAARPASRGAWIPAMLFNRPPPPCPTALSSSRFGSTSRSENGSGACRNCRGLLNFLLHRFSHGTRARRLKGKAFFAARTGRGHFELGSRLGCLDAARWRRSNRHERDNAD